MILSRIRCGKAVFRFLDKVQLVPEYPDIPGFTTYRVWSKARAKVCKLLHILTQLHSFKKAYLGGLL